MKIPTLIFATALCLWTGCMDNGVDPTELTYTRKKPDVANIVGVWVPTEESLRDMVKRGKYTITTHEIVLNPDSSFTMTNMPGHDYIYFDKPHQPLVSGTGTWRVGAEKQLWTTFVVELHFSDHWSSLPLSGQKPPYKIVMGNPDTGHYLRWVRRPPGERI